ncbi:MAG: hypothetical protein AAFP19_24980 [Bacteroidota bacterium]
MQSKLTFFWLMVLAVCWIGNAQAQQKGKQADDQISMDNPRKVNRTVQIDSADVLLFGETLSKQLQQTTQLQAFKLSNYLAEDPDSVDHMEGFTILETREITLDQQQSIAELLTSETPYMEDRSMKNLCLFLPDMAFVFGTEERPIKALISLDCKMVRFYFETENENRFVELNTKIRYKAFEEIYDDLFPEKKKSLAKNWNQYTKKEPTIQSMSNKGQALIYKVKPNEGLSHVAVNASKQYDQEITIKKVCELNDFDMKVVLQKGQEVIVGYIQ